MPRTRRAERAAAERQLLELPADILGLVLYQLTLAHDIAAVAPTCRQLCDAAKLALKARPYSGEVVTLAGHRGYMRGVATTLHGAIITGSYDGAVKMWRDGSCVRTIQAHTRDIECVVMLPGGARFVSGSEDGTAKLWTLDGILERTFEVGNHVHCVAALPDGVHFVVGGTIGDFKLYHVDGTLVHTFKGHTQSVNAVAVTPDGQHIISGADDTFVKVWSVATKSLVSTCRGHTDDVYALAVMPDAQRILSGSDDHTVRVWLLDGTLKNTFSELHNNTVFALVALPDNQHALAGSYDHTVKLFNVNDGAVLRTFKHHVKAVMCLALLPDGRRFVSGSVDRTACIVEHGLACEPSQAWIDAKPKRDALTAAVAAARTERELHKSQSLRNNLKERRIARQNQIEELERQSEQEGQRIERLSALEAEVQAAAGDPPRLQEAQARLTAEIGADVLILGDLHAYMVQ